MRYAIRNKRNTKGGKVQPGLPNRHIEKMIFVIPLAARSSVFYIRFFEYRLRLP